MKIGIFDPYLDDLGGGEKYMMIIAECLAKDHSVTVFWDNEEDLKELQERFLINLSSIALHKNIFSKNVSAVERLLTTRMFDAIFVLSDGSIPFVLSKKLFLHFQQPMQHLSKLSIKEKLKLWKVTSIFCNSQFTKSFIDKTFNVTSQVLYPPVALYPKKAKKENIILNVGRLRVKNVTVKDVPIGDYNAQHFKSLHIEIASDYKKQSTMIEAFKKMIQEGLRDWKFVIAVSVKKEDKEAFESLQKSAEGFPIEFVVNQNNKKLWDIYSRAKIYWHATGYGEDLQKHPEYAEHFGISTVEAMSAGVVPVVINAGGQTEIVENGKSGFLWDKIEDLIDKSLKLIRDQNLWKEMSKAASERSRKFTGNRFCKELKEIINL